MKIVVIGGTGQIGSKVVKKLSARGHEAVAAAPETGVDIITREGLAEVLKGATVVVDVTNVIEMDEKKAIAFFQTAARNIASAEFDAAVKHHVALSVLRSDRLTRSGYIAGKVAQEKVVQAASTPFTLVRAAQFFELLPMWVKMATADGVAKLPHVRFQPIAAEDVAETLVEAALAAPRNGALEVAGPEVFRMDELAQRIVDAKGERIRIEPDPRGTYFGAPLEDETLLPGAGVRHAPTTFAQWVRQFDTARAA